MAKLRETIALDQSKQKRVSQRVAKVKKNLQEEKPEIPNVKKENKLKAEKSRGLVYVGHIPHGFYETEMKNYFKQFGEVTNVSVSRSGKTGKSKGYGFVEFKNPEVAKIVADTMDNYIMFKKRLVVEFIPYEKRPKRLFCGKGNTEVNYAARRRRLKQMLTKNKTLTDQEVVKKNQATIKKLNKKLERLQNAGINCNLLPVNVPANIKPEKVHVKTETVDLDDSEVEIKVPKKASKKSHISIKESTKKLTESSKVLLTKSLDSVNKILTKSIKKSKSEDAKQLVEKTKKIKKKKTRGITKKQTKVPLDKGAVQKIARELIRKRGTPLLNLVPNKSKKI